MLVTGTLARSMKGRAMKNMQAINTRTSVNKFRFVSCLEDTFCVVLKSNVFLFLALIHISQGYNTGEKPVLFHYTQASGERDGSTNTNQAFLENAHSG